MKHTQLIKSASLVAFTLVLAGCGSTQYSSNPATPAPPLGEAAELAASYQTADGNTANTFITYGGNSEVNDEALVRSYSTNTATMTGPSRYLATTPGFGVAADVSGNLGDSVVLDSYWEVRENGTGAPVIVQYSIDKAAALADVVATVHHSESMGSRQAGAGTEFAVNFGADDVTTVAITDAGFTTDGDVAINLGGNYDYTAYTSSNYCNGVQAIEDDGIDYCGITAIAYSHLWKAEYAALYFMNHDSAQYSDNKLPYYRLMTYGNLTQRENLPATGAVTYNVNALGVYTDVGYDGYDTLLHGEGTLEADFDTSLLLLDLDMKDQNDDAFISFDGLEMELRDGYNHFANWSCNGGSDLGDCDTGTVDYQADSSFALDNINSEYLDAEGSFYGPNGEEVAGTIYHGDGIQDIEIGFIGEQQQD